MSHEREKLKSVADGIKKKNHPDYDKLKQISASVKKKVSAAVGKNKPKFGPETEGFVIHPHHEGAPKVKVVDPNFASRKEQTGKFKK